MIDWLEKVKTARAEGSFEKTMELLQTELASRPNDPQVHYQIAWTHDALGKERDAVLPYEKAIEYGLEGEDLRGAYLGLGSTLRCLGEYQKSLDVLKKAAKLFPDHRPFQVFGALTKFNLGRSEEAMGILIKQLAETSSDSEVQNYRRALLFYADRLKETFE